MLRNIITGKALKVLKAGFTVLDFHNFGSDVASGKFSPLPLLGSTLQMITDDISNDMDEFLLETAAKRGYQDMAAVLKSTVAQRKGVVGMYVGYKLFFRT